MQIISGCFLYPLTSFAICDQTNNQYNFFDNIIGKNTYDLFNCINDVMEYKKTNSAVLSNSVNNNYLSSVSHQKTLKTKPGSNYYKYYNNKLGNELKWSTGETKTPYNLVSCH